jgi:hypothetical protein
MSKYLFRRRFVVYLESLSFCYESLQSEDLVSDILTFSAAKIEKNVAK